MRFLRNLPVDTCLLAKKIKGENTLKSLDEFNPETIRSVLVISCTAMGDTLFAIPAIRSLTRLIPQAQIDLLVRDRFASLFRNLSYINKILKYRGRCRGSLELLSTFKKNRYDLCISLHDSDPCPVKVAFLAGIPFIVRIGQRDEMTAPFLSARTEYFPDKHAIEQRLDVLRLLFGSVAEPLLTTKMVLPVSRHETNEFWQAILGQKRITEKLLPKIGFQFSASGMYKTWPIENWAALGKRLLVHFDKASIVLLGGPADRSEAEKLTQAITEKQLDFDRRIINLAGKIPLAKLPAALKGLDVFVTNDTGPLHAAVALKVPTVSLFVPTRTRCIAPIQDTHLHTVVKKAMPCTPCIEKYCDSPDCMSLISVDEVFHAVIETTGLPG